MPHPRELIARDVQDCLRSKRIQAAVRLANRYQKRLPPDLCRAVYEAAAEWHMQCARDDLQKGYGRHVLQGLHHAESYAAKAGIPAPADIPLLRRESYEVSVRRKIGEAHDALTLAETYAHDGGIELPEDFQQLQRRLAELAQQP